MALAHEVAVDLVGEHDDLVLQGEASEAQQLVFPPHVARGVLGVAENQHPDVRGHLPFQIGPVNLEAAVLESHGAIDGIDASRLHHAVEAGVGRAHDERFVVPRHESAEGGDHARIDPVGDDEFPRIEIEAVALTVPLDDAVPEPVRRSHVTPGVMLHAGRKGFRDAGGTLEIHGGHAHAVAEDAFRVVPGGAIPAGRVRVSSVVDRIEIVAPPLHGDVGAAGGLGACAPREGHAPAGPGQGREPRAL